MAIFSKNYTVGISDISQNTSITNIGILNILEDIACRHSDKTGYGILDIPQTNLSWILLAWKVKILKRVSYGDVLKVNTWSRGTKKFYTYREFEVYDETGALVCIASSKWTLINTVKNSITPITDEIISCYKPEDKSVFENSNIDKIVEPENYDLSFKYTVQRRDIDVNHHMNNINYLNVAYEFLPDDIYFANECNNIEIMYKKGIKLGETVNCLYCKKDNINYVTLKSDDMQTLHAIIKLY